MPSHTFLAIAIAGAALASAARAEVVDTRELAETIEVSAGSPLVVIVRNVSGSVVVTGHDRDSVEMRATETVRGDLRADIERARTELGLVTEQEPGRIAFRVRRKNGDEGRGRGWGAHDGYRIEYDLEVKVPRDAAIELTTVNDGDVVADGVHGPFTLANVNGSVRLSGARSGGSATTVNGALEAVFDRAPTEGADFKTVNGEIDVTYPDSLVASLRFNSRNGDVFTDFDVAPSREPPTVERSAARGGVRMRAERSSAFEVGTGGPGQSFQTVNGNIYVRKAKR
jgi:hypothetical protein